MVAINFSVFLDKIESGQKQQTIRKKARCVPGQSLQLYTGMRTKACKKIGDATCASVSDVVIDEGYIAVDGFRLPSGDEARAAVQDGFVCPEGMRAFFRSKYGLPFEGQVIRWRDFTKPTDNPTQ